jgi:hypothetical protein
MSWEQYVSKSGMATFSTYAGLGDPGSAAWYEYYAYYAEPTIEQNVVERYFTVDNGQLTPKPVSADTGGAGNFTIPHPMGPQLTDSPRNNTQPTVRHKKSPDYLRAVGDTALMAGITAASIFLTPETGGLSDAAGVTAAAALTAELEDALATEVEDTASETVVDSTENTTVGRWMSTTEYDKMVETGKVQMSPQGNTTFVSNPASPDAFLGASKGSVYSEFTVPTNVLKPAGNINWAQIPGPNSFLDRFGQSQGELPITEMPDVKNIIIKGTK